MKTITINGREYRLNPSTPNLLRAEDALDVGLLRPFLSTDAAEAAGILNSMFSRMNRVLRLAYELAEPVKGAKPSFVDFVDGLDPATTSELVEPVLDTVFHQVVTAETTADTTKAAADDGAEDGDAAA